MRGPYLGMETKNKAKNTRSIFLDVLFTLLGVALICFILQCVLNFEELEFHKYVTFGLSFFSASMLLLLSIAELVSLSFDKTAVKSTLASTIFLLGYFLFSSDFVNALEFIGTEILPLTRRIFFAISNLSLYGATLFILIYYRNVYGISHFHRSSLILLTSIVVLSNLFTILSLDVVAFIFTSLESLLLLGLASLFFLKTKGDNALPGLITAIMVICLAFAIIFDSLTVSSFFTLNLDGLISLLFFVIIMGYVFIYAHFLISKTKGYYEYEESDIQRKMMAPHIKMKVTCFHTFDCYLGDLHLDFPSKKSKEFFALLVILRGKALSMDKAITYLWPEKDIDLAKRSYRDVIYKLRKFLGDNSFYGVTFKRAETLLNPNSLECDYYAIIERKDPYDGAPLMPEYDWSLDFENNLNK